MKSKTIASLVLSLFLAVPMFGQNLSVNYKARTIDKVLSDLESKTNYSFVYQKQELAGVPAITLELQNAPFMDVLNSVCAEAGLSYEIVKQSIVLKKGQPKQVAKAATVSGTVTDQNGEPVIGASVFVKGTNIGASTDAMGRYSIVANPGSTLVYSCIGYAEANRFATPGIIDVVLADDTNLLDETVVIGYGVQKKSDLTGSISSVKSDALQNRSVSGVTSALSGKVAGVQVITTSGMPGEFGQIRLRGLSSNNSVAALPLYIVDGIQVPDMNSIDPQDVESIEILKDGASAAIYGAQAGNGVVLITTKHGTKGRGKVSYDGSYTIAKLGYAPKMLNAQQYIDIMTTSGIIAQSSLKEFYDGVSDTNWLEEVYSGGYSKRNKVSFEGATDKSSYYLSISNTDEDGILASDRDQYKRLNVQVNAEHKIKDWLTVGTNNTFTRSKRADIWNLGGLTAGGSSTNGGLYQLTGMDPLTPAYYTDPSKGSSAFIARYNEGYNMAMVGDKYLSDSRFQTYAHPLFRVVQKDKAYNQLTQLVGNIYANFQPIKGLVYTSKFGYRFGNEEAEQISKVCATGNAQVLDPSYQGSISTILNYQWDNFVNYSHTFAEKHNLNAMAGLSYIENKSNYLLTTDGGSGFQQAENPLFFYPSFFGSQSSATIKGQPGKNSSISYFARLGYNFDERYYIQASFRADAFDESYLPATNRWGYFPSVSLGWNILNEPFMSGVDRNKVSYLKLRGSWGTNGNVAILKNEYGYTANVAYGSYLSVLDPYSHTLVPGAGPEGMANVDLKWETSKQLDFGVDARFFSDRLSATLDLYKKTTDGLLMESPIPSTTGWSNVLINSGVVENKGIELELSWNDSIGDFHYGVSANIAHNSNMVTAMDENVEYIVGENPQGGDAYATRMSVGEPLWYFYGYKFKGVNPEDGSGIYETGEDGVLNDDDKVNLGNANPLFSYGITLTAEYKGFDLVVFGTGSQGNKIWYGTIGSKERNMTENLYKNMWRNPGDNTKYPSFTEIFEKSFFRNSSAVVMDGSYFRINQLQLGYTLPKTLLSKVAVSSLRFYISLDNYFTFTGYKGFDPITAACDHGAGAGIDRGAYPSPKSMMFGVNLSF